MKARVSCVVITAFCFLLPGLLFAGDKDADLVKTIEARSALYAKYYNADDAASLTQLHAKKATVIPPNHGPVKGREAIQAMLAEDLAMGDQEVVLHTLEVHRIAKDTVYEIGSYSYKLVPEEGDPVMDEGNYVTIWKLEDEEWRLLVDTWNSSLPMK